MTNRIAHLLNEQESKPTIEQYAEQETARRRKLRHRTVIEIHFLDDGLGYAGKSLLTVDQHGLYWIDRHKELTPIEALRWYADNWYSRACENHATSQEELRKLLHRVADAADENQGGAK